jgi:hypothetical protein
MTRTLLCCILGGLLFAILLAMLTLPPGSAAQEPEPRPSPTPQPWIQITPNEGVAGEDLRVLVMGLGWPSPGSVRLTWERADGASLLPGPVEVGPNGDFTADVLIPTGWATPGSHPVFVTHSGGGIVAATLSFVAATPTDTPSPTSTPLPTDTDVPQPSVTPSRTPTWTPTAPPTLTPTPSSTLRPVTPDVTNTPPPAATARPSPLAPINTEAPTATPSATPRFPAMVTPTPADTEPPTGTATPMATATATATATPTRTPEATPTYLPVPRETRGPGQQLAQIVATPWPAAPVEAGLPRAGSRWESGFVLGFVAAVILLALLIILVLLVLVTVLVTWRIRQSWRTGRAA